MFVVFLLYLSKAFRMSTKYKATSTEDAYFIKITTVGWVDLFTRLNQKYIIINALQHLPVGRQVVKKIKDPDSADLQSVPTTM
jgi:hypothetical protein